MHAASSSPSAATAARLRWRWPRNPRRLGVAPAVAASMRPTAPAVAAATPTTPVAVGPLRRPAPGSACGRAGPRIQDLKGDVIRLNRDLLVLEEELLFPANTQVAVFVSMDVGKLFELDSVQIKLDDKVVANYLYTPREVEALHRGGVQRAVPGQPACRRARAGRLLHRQGPARARLQARRDAEVRQGHRPEVHRAADQGLDWASCSPSSTSRSGSRRLARSQHAPRGRCAGSTGLAAAWVAPCCWPCAAAGALAADAPKRAVEVAALRRRRCSTSTRSSTSRAITGLMVSQHFDRVAPHADEAEVLRGGMLLSYGMHQEAGRGLRPADRPGRAAPGARPRLVLPGQDPLPARLPGATPRTRSAASTSPCPARWRKTACCCRPTC